MICDNYNKLIEQGEAELFIAELLHIMMNDERYFNRCTKLVNDAKRDGLLQNVKFYPTPAEILDAELNINNP
jgi:hypothetical protein